MELTFKNIFLIYIAAGSIYAFYFLIQLRRANDIIENTQPIDEEDAKDREDIANNFHNALNTTRGNQNVLLVFLFVLLTLGWIPLIIYTRIKDRD